VIGATSRLLRGVGQQYHANLSLDENLTRLEVAYKRTVEGLAQAADTREAQETTGAEHVHRAKEVTGWEDERRDLEQESLKHKEEAQRLHALVE
jgi:hypothetical protein